MIMRTLLAFLCVLAAGCETLGGGAQTSSSAQEAPDSNQQAASLFSSDDVQTLNALYDSKLPEKSCGMILWTLDAQRPSPVFKYIVGEQANIVVGGVDMQLVRTRATGESVFGIFQNQEFESVDGVRMEVTSRLGAGFDGGVYLERGLVKVYAPDGWSIVAPAAGIAGCRS